MVKTVSCQHTRSNVADKCIVGDVTLQHLKFSGYADEYRERALAMIEKKVEDEEIKAVPPAPRRTGQVVYPLDHQPPGIPITPRELQISSTR